MLIRFSGMGGFSDTLFDSSDGILAAFAPVNGKQRWVSVNYHENPPLIFYALSIDAGPERVIIELIAKRYAAKGDKRHGAHQPHLALHVVHPALRRRRGQRVRERLLRHEQLGREPRRDLLRPRGR